MTLPSQMRAAALRPVRERPRVAAVAAARPREMPRPRALPAGVPIDWIVILLAGLGLVLLGTMPSTLLTRLKIHYVSSGGAFYEKFHPATYVFVLAFCATLLRDRMARAITDGLVASGADVVTAPGGIVYRVRGTLELEGRTYILRLEMLDGETGAVVEGREDRCEICTESEALETAGVAASALKAQVFKRRPAIAVNSTVTVPAPGGGAGPPMLQESGTPLESERPAHPHRALGVAGIAAGAAAVAVGAWLLSIDHKGTCAMPDQGWDGCYSRYNTFAGGASLAAGGGLALIAGVLAVSGVF